MLRLQTIQESIDTKKLSPEDKAIINLVPGGLKIYKEVAEDDPDLTPTSHVIEHFTMLHDDNWRYARRFYNKVAKTHPEIAKKIVDEYGDDFMYD